VSRVPGSLVPRALLPAATEERSAPLAGFSDSFSHVGDAPFQSEVQGFQTHVIIIITVIYFILFFNITVSDACHPNCTDCTDSDIFSLFLPTNLLIVIRFG
jgi:hypothetical protein